MTAQTGPTSTPDYVSLLAEGVSKVFGRRMTKVVAVKPLDFEFDSDSAIGIVGESGSGKSTLSRMFAGLEKSSTGTITFNSHEIHDMLSTRLGRIDFRRNVQYVAQDTSSSFDPRASLGDALATPLRVLCGVKGSEAQDRMREIARLLRISPDHFKRYPREVSGGQRQRFALARSLVVRPRILLCDEVVSALDVSVQGAVLNMIKEYCRESRVGLGFVSHGLPATAFISDELVVMWHGEVVERGSTEQILHDPRHPYTQRLLGAYTSGRYAGKA